MRSATTSWLWIVSKFTWWAATKASSSSSGKRSITPCTIARTESSTNIGCMCACSTTYSSSGRLSSARIGADIELSAISISCSAG